jgi:hypothetical protein
MFLSCVDAPDFLPTLASKVAFRIPSERPPPNFPPRLERGAHRLPAHRPL